MRWLFIIPFKETCMTKNTYTQASTIFLSSFHPVCLQLDYINWQGGPPPTHTHPKKTFIFPQVQSSSPTLALWQHTFHCSLGHALNRIHTTSPPSGLNKRHRSSNSPTSAERPVHSTSQLWPQSLFIHVRPETRQEDTQAAYLQRSASITSTFLLPNTTSLVSVTGCTKHWPSEVPVKTFADLLFPHARIGTTSARILLHFIFWDKIFPGKKGGKGSQPRARIQTT